MKMTDRTFMDDTHWQCFTSIINKMQQSDVYHMSMAYLLSLDTVTRQHVSDIFDYDEDCIRTDALQEPWQTGTSQKTTRLAFNLWNGCCSDGDTYTDSEGYTADLPSGEYSVVDIFSCSYAAYYWEAVKIRFPEYTN